MYGKTYQIDVEGKTGQEVLDEIRNLCLDARRNDREIVIIGAGGNSFLLAER